MDGTTVVINRREPEFSVSGLMGEQYPAPYIKHLVDRLHHPGALRLLDLEVVESEEIIQACQSAGGHTEGSMNILVETDSWSSIRRPLATTPAPSGGRTRRSARRSTRELRAARPRPPRDGRGRARRRSALRQRAGARAAQRRVPRPADLGVRAAGGGSNEGPPLTPTAADALAGRAAVVTGGSFGIGRAVAQELTRRGRTCSSARAIPGGFTAEEIAARTPLRRLAEPEEVARVVAFVASGEASYITGSSVLVDGGWVGDGGWMHL